MAISPVGAGANIQQALGALRQTVQAEQVAAAAITEAARNAVQTTNHAAAAASTSSGEGAGENESAEHGVDVEA